MSVRDCRIQVMRGGSGSPMLFLHGGGGVGIWLPCMARLAKKFDVIAPEHPGFGASETPEWLDTIGDLANFYLDFLDQLDLADVHIVGSFARRLDRCGARGGASRRGLPRSR